MSARLLERASERIAYAYVHGFRSSPSAKKGTHLRDALAADGVVLHLPDMNQPSFAKLSVGAMLAHVDALHEARGRPRWRLVGSSLGGFLSARWAELYPERVESLVLLCPAFDIAARWPTILEPGRFERWQRDGAIDTEDASGAPARLHYAFYEEACAHPAFPRVERPVTVIHGRRDETVPIESSRRWVASIPQARLVEVDDGHELVGSLPLIEREVRARFGLAGARGVREGAA